MILNKFSKNVKLWKRFYSVILNEISKHIKPWTVLVGQNELIWWKNMKLWETVKGFWLASGCMCGAATILWWALLLLWSTLSRPSSVALWKFSRHLFLIHRSSRTYFCQTQCSLTIVKPKCTSYLVHFNSLRLMTLNTSLTKGKPLKSMVVDFRIGSIQEFFLFYF